MTCPRCGGEVEAGDARCEHCGHRLTVAAPAPEPAPEPGARVLIARLGCGMLGLMLALIAVMALFGLLLGGLLGAAPAGVAGAWA